MVTHRTVDDSGPAAVSESGRPPRPVPSTPAVVALLATAGLAILVPLLAVTGIDFFARPVLAVAFLVFVPGVPVAMALRLRSAQATAALAFATSFSYHGIFGAFAITDAFWHPIGSSWIATIIAVGFTVVALGSWRPGRSGNPGSSTAAGSAPEAPAPEPLDAPEPTRRSADADRVRWTSLALVLVAAGFWFWETRTVALSDAGAYGLLEVVGWRYGVALTVLGGVTLYTLFRRHLDHLVMTAAAAMWALIGYATVPVADGQGTVPVGWIHVAFVQYISDFGTVPSSYDARFSWPGFFAAGAQLVSLAGTADARSFLVLAPIVYFLAALPGLLLIARSITHSWRWSWIAVLVYELTNWYQQDYFSPQATAFVIYVTIIGVLLWMIDTAVVPRLRGSLAAKIVGALRRTPALPDGMSARTAQALGLLLAVLCGGVVVIHQLTPFTLIFALAGFALVGLTRYRLLWVTAGLVFVGYFSYGATDFWLGHLDGLLGDVGQVSSAISSSVGGRIVGDATYQSNQYYRIGWSVMLFAGAAVGVWMLRRRREALLLAGLSCAPFALLVVQSYGGEVVIRSFLYASPILAPLFAVALRRGIALLRSWLPDRGPAVTSRPLGAMGGWLAALLPVVVVAALMLTFTRGLNTSFERTPPDQVTAGDIMQAAAVRGDEIGVPLFRGVTPYAAITEIGLEEVNADTCADVELTECIHDPLPRYVIITITQERLGELTRSRPDGWVWALGQQLIDSGRYTRIYTGADAWLLELNPGGGS